MKPQQRVYPITDLHHSRYSLLQLERDKQAGLVHSRRYKHAKQKIKEAITYFEKKEPK